MKTIRFYWAWIRLGIVYHRALRIQERYAPLLKWLEATQTRSIADETEDWLASLAKVNPESEGDGA